MATRTIESISVESGDFFAEQLEILVSCGSDGACPAETMSIYIDGELYWEEGLAEWSAGQTETFIIPDSTIDDEPTPVRVELSSGPSMAVTLGEDSGDGDGGGDSGMDQKALLLVGGAALAAYAYLR